MLETLKFWGFDPDVCAEVLGSGKPLHQETDQVNTPLFGRVTLAEELIERCDAHHAQATAGWWTWLLMDPTASPPGKPVAWFDGPTGERFPIISRIATNTYRFAFDVDETVRFIQNERYLVHAPPGYLQLGIDPNRLPRTVRRVAMRGLHVVRSLRGRRGPIFPAHGEAAVDIWRALIRTLTEESVGVSIEPMWPNGKRYAVTLSGDIDTDFCLNNERAMRPCLAAIDSAGMRAAWLVVGNLVDAGQPALDDLHDQGHEIGYHGLVHDHKLAFLPPDQIAKRISGARGIIQRYGASGFRSPNYLRSAELYQALDSALSYDMSMHDAIGNVGSLSQRQEGCGTCFPFTIAKTDVTEIPTTVPEDWDLELDGLSPEQACERQMRAIERIRERGGAAHICIHPEPCFTLRPEWLRAYARLLAWVAEDDSAWLALPGELDRHWRARAKRIAEKWAPSTRDVMIRPKRAACNPVGVSLARDKRPTARDVVGSSETFIEPSLTHD